MAVVISMDKLWITHNSDSDEELPFFIQGMAAELLAPYTREVVQSSKIEELEEMSLLMDKKPQTQPC